MHIAVLNANVDRSAFARGWPDAAASAGQPCSRLSCQIIGRPELDGLVLHVPA